MKRWAIFAALCIASMGVHAQVYRCGNTYTQEPCKGGREVDVTPPVSDLSGPKTTVIYLCRAQGGSRVRHLAGISDPSPEAASIQINDLGFPKRAFFKPL
jgi:hypothetical protein